MIGYLRSRWRGKGEKAPGNCGEGELARKNGSATVVVDILSPSADGGEHSPRSVGSGRKSLLAPAAGRGGAETEPLIPWRRRYRRNNRYIRHRRGEGPDGSTWQYVGDVFSVQRYLRMSMMWRHVCIAMWVLVTLAAATAVFSATYKSFQDERQVALVVECEAYKKLLQGHFTDTSNQIRLLANLMTTFHYNKPPGTLDRATFMGFLNDTEYARPRLRDVSFAASVPQAERGAYERAQGGGFCIKHDMACAGQQSDYAPILYTTSSLPLIGQDMLWDAFPANREAVIRARDQGIMGALTPPLQMAVDSLGGINVGSSSSTGASGSTVASESSGNRDLNTVMLRVYPVYEERTPPDAGAGVAEFRSKCRGFMSAAIDFEPLIKSLHREHMPMFVPRLLRVPLLLFRLGARFSHSDVASWLRVVGGELARAPIGARLPPHGAAKGQNEGLPPFLSLHFSPRLPPFLSPHPPHSPPPHPPIPLPHSPRYLDYYVFPYSSLGWALVIITVMSLLGYVWWVASSHVHQLEHDFHRMELLKDKMKAARNVAERASKAKGTFLATMSHELRTPMNGVIGMLNLLLETPLTITQLDYVETARTSGRALLELINDILDLSKIETSQKHPHFTWLLLIDVYRRCFGLPYLSLLQFPLLFPSPSHASSSPHQAQKMQLERVPMDAQKMQLERVPMDVRGEVDTVLTMFIERFRDKPLLQVDAYVDPLVTAAVLGDSLRLRQ
ncbi:unnamed protein product, partial [Closterium sp. NIES-65]